jgi:hypothetical protein
MSSSNTKKINDELQEREQACNNTIIYEYERPSKDPFDYENYDSFKEENPFDQKKNCKVLIPDNEEDLKTDKYNRYYKDIYTNTRCKTANGFWVGSTVNRNNNYEKGNCWKEEEDAQCGALLHNYKLIRKKDYQDGNVSRDEIKSARSKCEVNPKCYFKRISEFKRDCVSRKRLSFSNSNSNSNKRSKSSSKMSSEKLFIDMNNIEKSLDEFYSSNYKPQTSELIGNGNRCVDNYINSKSSSKSKSKSSIKEEEKIANIDIIDENLESKMDYLNDVIKLEHMYENLSIKEFSDKYYKYFKEYTQFLLLNLDPNDQDNVNTIFLYLDEPTSKSYKNFLYEYNKYISILKIFANNPKKPLAKEYKKYNFNYISSLYHKYFSVFFDSYNENDKKIVNNYKMMHKMFIRFLIQVFNPNDANNNKWFLLYINNKDLFKEFKKTYNEGIVNYYEYFSYHFNLEYDTYIETIKKNYYLYCRYIIAKTDPLDEDNHPNLIYFINNRDPKLFQEFLEAYKQFNSKDANPFDYYTLYNTYFTNFYQYTINIDFIYYIKNKIYHLDPNIKSQYDELEKYISNPSLIKEYKINYNLISTNVNYDNDLLKLHKKYFPDYFQDINKKYNLSSSSSFLSSSATPVFSEPSTPSSSLPPKPPKLPTVPQSIINNICKVIHHKKIDKRGMLIWHSTGSGKTCTATSIMEGFWGTNMDIIYCSTIPALTSNPATTFYKCASDLFPRFAGKTIQQMEKEFNNVRFLTFAKLANRIKNNTINLNNCIIIIDEVHNLFRPIATQKSQHEYLEKLLLDEKKYPKLKVFILTATLGDNPNEIIKLLNIVKNNSVPKITYDDISNTDVFKEKIRGLISYFDMSSDRSKFPLVIDNEPRYINMSKKQFEEYIQKYKAVKESHKNYDKLAAENSLQKYWMAARKYSNMLYNFEKNTTLDIFSPKLQELLNSLLSFPNQKQYVYSAFYENKGYGGQGILAVAFELKKRGYEQLTPAEAKKIYDNPTDSDKKPRFILAITTQLPKDDKGKGLSEMTKLYNAEFNKNGEYVNIILASQSFNEGLDLKAVRHIHIFEPLITWASDKQTIGRAARNCSHSDLRLKEWTVNIHRYISNFPEEIAQDQGKLQELKELYKQKNSQLDQYAVDLKEQQEKFKNGKAKMTKLIKDKKKTKDEIKATGDLLQEELNEYSSNVEEIKKIINGIKDEIKEIKKELKNFDDNEEEEVVVKGKGKGKGKNKGVKLDAKGIENIDKFIYSQARDKMKQILELYQAMKESAVDCLVLNKFHNINLKGSDIINCTNY